MASSWDTNNYDWTKSATDAFSGWSGGSNPTFSVDWGNTLDLPGLSGTGTMRTPGILSGTDWSGSVPSYSRNQDFNVGRAIEAVSKSLGQLGSSSSGIQRSLKGNVSGAQLVGEGRGYRLYEREPDVKETRKTGGGGLFGTIGGIAGPLLAATPFVGPLAAPIAAGVGRGIDAFAGT
jgi:hypothetical protein